MTDAEAAAFLDEQWVMTCATHGPRGFPHLMPLWYVVREGSLWAWTYRKSQKVVNLRRDPRTTLQIESGGTEYGELRGVMIEAQARLHENLETVSALGAEILSRYTGGRVGAEMVAAQAPKRIAMEFAETRRVSWDHRKLGGTY